jgi:hypothetical protein
MDSMAMQCIKFCKKNNIIVLPYVEEAVAELKKMRNGTKGKSHWPAQLRSAHREVMGSDLI